MPRQPSKPGRSVIRTHRDFYEGMFPRRPVPSRLPIPFAMQSAAGASMATGQPITIMCDGDTWTVTPEQAREFSYWITTESIKANHRAMRAARGRGRPKTDWWMLITRLMERVQRGEILDAALDLLRRRYGIQTLAEAHLWVKAQRQASIKRLRELAGHPTSGNVTDYEGNFHRDVVKWFPPRRPGRPRVPKSGQ